MKKRLRFGCQNLINTLPILYAIPENDPSIEIVQDSPAALAKMLLASELDAAVIPSVEYLHNPEYVITSPICIASRGPVMSVKLYSRKPFKKIETLALDAQSMTSARLVRIILAERFGIAPHSTVTGLVKDLSHTPTDAVLVIGDNALVIDTRGFKVLDLGKEWFDLTGLPFVFALCCCRRGADLNGLPARLEASLDAGLAGIDGIIEKAAKITGTDHKTLARYYSRSIRYRLGQPEVLGLIRFFRMIVDHEMWHEGRDLEFL